MIRALYFGLIWLHPPGFREEFGDEMLWIFDENPRESLAFSRKFILLPENETLVIDEEVLWRTQEHFWRAFSSARRPRRA